MKNITWSGRLVLTLVLAAAGSGLLLRAQDSQHIGTFAPIAFGHQRSHAAAATLADGRTVIVGGFDAEGNATADVAIFDPASGAVQHVADLIAPRAGHTATGLTDGRVLIAGGLVDGAPAATFEVFDPADNTIAALEGSTMTSARSGHAAARLADGTVLIVGGSDGTAALSSAEVFDPATGASASMTSMATARAGASATLLIDNRVLVAGGSNESGDLATAEIYYPFAGSWEPTTTNLGVARSGHAAVLLPWNGSVLIAGGQTVIDNVSTPIANADLFVPAEFPDPYSWGMGTFATTNPLTAARNGAFAGPLGDNGLAFVAGGGPDADRYRFATVKTDKDDYAPGEFAVITGSGWQPLETVTLLFQEDPPMHDDYVRTALADEQGNFELRDWAPEQHDLDVRFYLLASGAQSRAQTTFTDGLATVSVLSPTTPTPTTIASLPANVTISFNYRTNGSGGTQSATASVKSGATTIASASKSVVRANGAGGANDSIVVTIPPGTANGGYDVEVTVTDTGTGNPSSLTDTEANAININVATVNTTTSVNNATATYGDTSVTLNATVTPASGPAINSGSVTFTVKQGLTTIGSATTDNTVVAGAASVSYGLPAGTAAGSYTIEATYTPGAGFNTSSGSGSLTINRKDATWTTNPNSKTYGDSEPVPVTTGSGTDFLAADNVTATYSRVAGENASPPTYHITATLSATPMSALNNYNITNNGAEFTITKRLATWTTNSASKTYGDVDPSPLTTGSGTNFVAADNVTATYSRVAGENASPPTYHIMATLSATPLSALDNYTITNDGAEFTIDKRQATWTTNPASKTYGDADPVPLTTGSGNFVAADNVTASYTRVAGENASPPTYHITATLSATPMSALDNYIITNDGAEFTIDKRLATWTTNPASKTYGDSDPTPLTTGNGSNFIAADNVTASYTRVAGENASPPTYHITATLSATPLSALDNYIITNNGAEFTIDKRPATVKADDKSKIFGEVNPPLTATVTGTVNGDVLNYTLATTATQFSFVSPPTYPIAVTLGSNPNYQVTPTDGSLTVLTACSAFNGFLSPIGGVVEKDTGGSFSDPVRAFKLNSTIPVKFTATCNGTTLVTGVQTLQAIKYNSSTDSEPAIDATPTDAATAGNQFRLTGSEWHFNLNTKSLGGNAQGTYLLKATLFDGSSYSVWVSIKK